MAKTQKFDQVWRIIPKQSTYELFLHDLETRCSHILDQQRITALQKLAGHYRQFESQRWDVGRETYHTHGIYSAWICMDIFVRFSQQLEEYFDADPPNLSCEEGVFKEGSFAHYVFVTIVAAMLHDVGGVHSEDHVSTNPDRSVLQRFIDKIPLLDEKSGREIICLTKLTDYKTDGALYFDRTGKMKCSVKEISTNGLLVTISDLLQLGAIDYLKRVEHDLQLDVSTYPPQYLLILQMLLKSLAHRIHLNITASVIPEQIRQNVCSIVMDQDKYDWEQAPTDLETGELLCHPQTGHPWDPETLSPYLQKQFLC